jgi:hypothetical protein
VRTGHGKPGKSWNLIFHFPGLESHWISFQVMESHGIKGVLISLNVDYTYMGECSRAPPIL